MYEKAHKGTAVGNNSIDWTFRQTWSKSSGAGLGHHQFFHRQGLRGTRRTSQRGTGSSRQTAWCWLQQDP